MTVLRKCVFVNARNSLALFEVLRNYAFTNSVNIPF